MCSNIIYHIYTYPLTVFEAGSKSPSRTTPNKPNPLCLDAFDTDAALFQIQMRNGTICLQRLSQFLAECNCAGSSSISQTTHTTTSTHLGPKSTAPRPLHCRIHDSTPNWCQRPCHLTSRLWLRPDHHEMHSESNLDARNKDVNLCEFKKIDLKVFGKHPSL